VSEADILVEAIYKVGELRKAGVTLEDIHYVLDNLKASKERKFHAKPCSPKPPLGLRPREIFYQQSCRQRVEEIEAAIKRYNDAGWTVPIYWTNELISLKRW